MIDYVKHLTEAPNGVLATRLGDEVRTRAFQFLFAVDEKVYFCTSNKKPVYHQLKACPEVSFCSWGNDFTPVVSVSGKAFFTDDPSLKERALEENPAIQGIYQSADNPDFVLFYVVARQVQTFSFAIGKTPFLF